jgi:hypothetical protein
LISKNNYQSWVNDETYANILNLVKYCFSQGNYNCIGEKEFPGFLFMPSTLKNLSVLTDYRFIMNNQNLVTKDTVARVIKAVNAEPANGPLVESFRLTNRALDQRKSPNHNISTEDQLKFLENLKIGNNSNCLLAIHTLPKISTLLFQQADTGILDHFCAAVLNVFIGKSNNVKSAQICRNHVSNLLYFKLNISENKAVLAWLLDCFINEPDFQTAQKVLGLNLALLSRVVESRKELRMVLKIQKKVMGDKAYETYIGKLLPKVLKKYYGANFSVNLLENTKVLADYQKDTLSSDFVGYLDETVLDQGARVFYYHNQNLSIDFWNYINKDID